MPTLPGPGSEQFRQVATSFGSDARRYDRTWPSYPRAMVDRLLAESPGPGSGVRAGSGPRVLDVGCGTGIVGRLFQAAGAEVLGVDPDERMAAQARAGGLEVEVARIEEWEPCRSDVQYGGGRASVALDRSGGGREHRRTRAAARWAAGRVLEQLPAPARPG